MRWAWLVLGLAAACSEYDIKGADTEPEPPLTDDTSVPTDSEPDTEPPPPDEECNGEDDNGDGVVDEGFPDTDGDGEADCVDPCTTAVPPAGTVTIDEDCFGGEGGGEVTDPWNLAIEWDWTGLSANPSIQHVIQAPMVGNLDDDDGDGDADEDDVPDIVFVAYASYYAASTLVVLDGATGIEKWSRQGVSHFAATPALADVDTDGFTDIVFSSPSGQAVAYTGDGTLMWMSTVSSSNYAAGIAVADLEGDGQVEVVFDHFVLDGATGALLQTLANPVSSGINYHTPAIGDIDLDGYQEVIVGANVYGPGGALEWSSPGLGTYGHWVALINADKDPEGEVAVVTSNRYLLHEHNGAVTVDMNPGSGNPGPPCAGDFDGDGEAEIAWAMSGQLSMRELDGTPVWTATVQDLSGLAACSGYDLDGDGALEVLFADEASLHVFDGVTGAVRYEVSGHASGTVWEYPVIADVDNDGSAEFILPNDSYSYTGWTGVTVFGQATDGWLKSGPTWNSHDFSVTNILADGSVPASPTPSWQVHNVYRARPAVDTLVDLADLKVEIFDVCFDGCEPDDLVTIVVRVSNAGLIASGGDVPVSLYARDGGILTWLDTQWVSGPLDPGVVAAGVVFEIPVSDYGPDGIAVQVDDDGAGLTLDDECFEEDNLVQYTDSACP
jgi:hypothetical protein